jgi:hypothetical protein
LASFLHRLAQTTKNFPKYLPEHLFPSSSAWTNNKGVAGRLDRRAGKMNSTPADKISEQEKKGQDKSYLSAAVESISPWSNSRSSTPKPKEKEKGEGSGLKNQHGGDHSTTYWRGLSKRRYPNDCPELNARWFYAVDVRLLPLS